MLTALPLFPFTRRPPFFKIVFIFVRVFVFALLFFGAAPIGIAGLHLWMEVTDVLNGDIGSGWETGSYAKCY